MAGAAAGFFSAVVVEGSGMAARGVRGGVLLRHDRMPLGLQEMRSDSACTSGCCLRGVVAWDCADVKLSAVCISSFACMWIAMHVMTGVAQLPMRAAATDALCNMEIPETSSGSEPTDCMAQILPVAQVLLDLSY